MISDKYTIQDERSKTLYSKEPIIIPEDKYSDFIEKTKKNYNEAKDYFEQNYEQDFVRDIANYMSIPSESYKPWSDANDYFMPATNITVENYVARMMETIRGGRDFITVYPRGRSDEEKAKLVQLYLRYMFETPMRGFRPLNNTYRSKCIFGTAICHMPWNLQYTKVKIDGTYIWDKGAGEEGDWIRELIDEGTSEIDDKPPPKDFSDFTDEALEQILKSNKDYIVKDLYEVKKLKDNPELELLDLFNVKIDPSGGPDIQKHRYTIIESVESIDDIRRKVAQGIYDKDQVDKLLMNLPKDTKVNVAIDNNGISQRNANEGITDTATKSGVKIWTIYDKDEIESDGFEEEIIAVIANKEYLLSFIRTPFNNNGHTFRPLLVDKFIELPYRFYGLGICRMLEELNFLLNHLVNQILNHGDLMNSPPLIYPQEGQWDPNYSVFGPGQTWPSDNVDGFKILPTPDIKASQIQMVIFVEGFIQKSLGISDFTLGRSTGSIVTNDTAHGMANILRETNRRLDYYSQTSHETFIKDMFEMILLESQLFLDETEIPKITDIKDEEIQFKFNTIENKDLQGFYDIKIYANSLTASKEFDQIKWQNMLQIFSQIQDPQTGMPLYDIKHIGDKVLESNGEPFPANYHYAPDQEKMNILNNAGQPQEVNAANPKPVPAQAMNESKDGTLGAY